MTETNATRAAGSTASACSALISALRCVTDAAIQTTLLPRSEIGRILREEAAIIETGREHDNARPHGERVSDTVRDVVGLPKG